MTSYTGDSYNSEVEHALKWPHPVRVSVNLTSGELTLLPLDRQYTKKVQGLSTNWANGHSTT